MEAYSLDVASVSSAGSPCSTELSALICPNLHTFKFMDTPSRRYFTSASHHKRQCLTPQRNIAGRQLSVTAS